MQLSPHTPLNGVRGDCESQVYIQQPFVNVPQLQRGIAWFYRYLTWAPLRNRLRQQQAESLNISCVLL